MKPLILLTNDDGVFSPGLQAAAQAAEPLGELLIVAPRYQQTGMGRSFPMGEDVGKIERFPSEFGGEMYGVYGSPAHAVAHAILEIAPRKPDLCVSGVNYGENLGRCLSCSGTLGAALEADSHGVPSIAFSRQAAMELQKAQDYAELDWTVSRHVVRRLLEGLLKRGMGDGISIWNINIPNGADPQGEVRITFQSGENCFEFQRPSRRDWKQGYQLASSFRLSDSLTARADAYAFYIDKVVSATPLTWNMTAASNLRPEESF